MSQTGYGHKTRIIAICVLLVGLLPVSAAAQSASTVLSDFGVIGRWTNGEIACDAPSLQNQIETYTVIASGEVGLRIEFGPGRAPNDSTIHEASRIAADQISIKATLANGKNQEWIFLKQDGKLRTISNKGDNDTYVVKDGIILAAGKPTPWRQRCQNDGSAPPEN